MWAGLSETLPQELLCRESIEVIQKRHEAIMHNNYYIYMLYMYRRARLTGTRPWYGMYVLYGSTLNILYLRIPRSILPISLKYRGKGYECDVQFSV